MTVSVSGMKMMGERFAGGKNRCMNSCEVQGLCIILSK